MWSDRKFTPDVAQIDQPTQRTTQVGSRLADAAADLAEAMAAGADQRQQGVGLDGAAHVVQEDAKWFLVQYAVAVQDQRGNRELEAAGFVNRGGRASHRNSVHPKVARPVTRAGREGGDGGPTVSAGNQYVKCMLRCHPNPNRKKASVSDRYQLEAVRPSKRFKVHRRKECRQPILQPSQATFRATVSRTPSAPRTFVTVPMRGSRSPDNALYRLGRPSCVSCATVVMPTARATLPTALTNNSGSFSSRAASRQHKQYTKRMLPWFVIPECNIRLDLVLNLLKLEELDLGSGSAMMGVT